MPAAAGPSGGSNTRCNRSQGQVEELAQVYRDIGTGNVAKSQQQLDKLAGSGSKAVHASALFTRAALALQQNNHKLAIAKYREIAATASLPSPIATSR